MTIKKYLLVFILVLSFFKSRSQDWTSSLDSLAGADNGITSATFKSTRLIDQQTIEVCGKRTLDFRISHRFGPLNSGAYNAWGIDGPANIRLGLDYSFDGRLMFGIGRSSYDKMVDGFLNTGCLRQASEGMPISVTLFAGAYWNGVKDVIVNGFDKYGTSWSRFSYCYELMIARKFSSSFSLQVAPWLVHYNIVENIDDKNDSYGISGLFRFKFTKRSAVTAEYSYRLNDFSPSQTYYESFGIGYELETGGHVFQIHFINSFGMCESQFFPMTNSDWNSGGVRLGFNISRVFTL